MSDKYIGSLRPKRAFMKEYIVVCPKCQKDAQVTAEWSGFRSQGELRCRNCYYKTTSIDHIRFAGRVDKYCYECGGKICIELPVTKHRKSKIIINCNDCGLAQEAKPKYKELSFDFYEYGRFDLVFGHELWLQVPVRNKIIYAYNYYHLQEIRRYVSANLRERQTLEHTTMVEKLPKFIVSAKNRKIILKAIDRLYEKF